MFILLFAKVSKDQKFAGAAQNLNGDLKSFQNKVALFCLKHYQKFLSRGY
jgi:hypothetical protein